MVYGLHGDHVLARDPAAATNEEVERRYRMDEFGEAWLKRRGATYIFCNTLRSKE